MSASPEAQNMNAVPMDVSRPGSTTAVYGGSRSASVFDHAAGGDGRPNTGQSAHYTSYARDDGMLRPPSVITDDGSAGSDTDGSPGAAATAAGAGRPSFKRLASQTLGPANSKRAMVAYEQGGSPFDDDHDDEASYEPAVPRQVVNLSDRYRRMSAPTGVTGLVDGGYA